MYYYIHVINVLWSVIMYCVQFQRRSVESKFVNDRCCIERFILIELISCRRRVASKANEWWKQRLKCDVQENPHRQVFGLCPVSPASVIYITKYNRLKMPSLFFMWQWIMSFEHIAIMYYTSTKWSIICAHNWGRIALSTRSTLRASCLAVATTRLSCIWQPRRENAPGYLVH